MIPMRYIDEWRGNAPWQDTDYVEQDLVISRALIVIFNEPELRTSLAFRGGTALNKLYFNLDLLLTAFDKYISYENRKISRAEFEKNLYEKQKDTTFIHDMDLLLSSTVDWDVRQGFQQIIENIISHMPGEPWSGVETAL